MTSLSYAESTPRTASEWFAARRECHDAGLEQRFSKWISESPRNLEEYALCELTWELSAAAVEGIDTPLRTGPWYRRRSLLGFAAAACIALAAFTAIWFWTPTSLTWHTAPGEQRAIVLNDGSRILLNTRSTLEARMGRSMREIRLRSGEAFFEVARDAKRPFVVETSLGTARALGTRFNVLLEPRRMEIATEEGQVLVTALASHARGVLTAAGLRATIVRGDAAPALDQADLSRIENWQARRLEFDRLPLDAALREFSRYTAMPIRAATPEIGRTPVSAVLRVGDVEALRATLKAAFGLTLVEGGNGWLVAAAASNSAERGQ